MQPSVRQPPVEPSPAEQAILQRIHSDRGRSEQSVLPGYGRECPKACQDCQPRCALRSGVGRRARLQQMVQGTFTGLLSPLETPRQQLAQLAHQLADRSGVVGAAQLSHQPQ